MPIGNSNIHKKFNVSELINKLSFICVLWTKSCSEMKCRRSNHFSTIIISKSQIETLVSYSRSTNVKVNMSFPNSNFEGNFSIYVFGKSFWHYRDFKSECCTSQHILCKKILNFFICLEDRILCKKVKYVWSSQFPQAITTNMQIGNDTFVFKYPVTCKQKI